MWALWWLLVGCGGPIEEPSPPPAGKTDTAPPPRPVTCDPDTGDMFLAEYSTGEAREECLANRGVRIGCRIISSFRTWSADCPDAIEVIRYHVADPESYELLKFVGGEAYRCIRSDGTALDVVVGGAGHTWVYTDNGDPYAMMAVIEKKEELQSTCCDDAVPEHLWWGNFFNGDCFERIEYTPASFDGTGTADTGS